MNYKGFLITIEKHHWGFFGSALGDNGEYLTRKMIGYNATERKQIMRDAINEYLGDQK